MQQGAHGKGRGDAAGRSHNGRNSERTDQPLRLNSQTRQLGAWTETEHAWQQASQRLQAVIDFAHEAKKNILKPRSASVLGWILAVGKMVPSSLN